jgi:general L-amino acid transport system permease protein
MANAFRDLQPADGRAPVERPPPPARLSWLAPARRGPLLVQALLLLAALGAIGFIAANTAANMARLNMHVGFAFLGRPAGFDIAQALLAYPEDATYLQAFLVAVANTVLLAAIAIVLATALGFVVAMARLSLNPLLSLVALGYVEAVRNIPLLLQLFFWYFAVLGPLPLPRQSLHLGDWVFLNKRGLFLPAPVAEASFATVASVAAIAFLGAAWFAWRARRMRVETGATDRTAWSAALILLALPVLTTALAGAPVGWEKPHLAGFNLTGGIAVIPEFFAMIIALTVYGSAFISELIRGGVVTVHRGQFEAGLALGLSRGQVYRKIVIPQAFRAIVPPLTGQYIHLMKNSTLAAAIGYPDLMLIFAGTALNQSGQPLEIMGMTMASYLVLSLSLSAAGNWMNRRMQLVER